MESFSILTLPPAKLRRGCRTSRAFRDVGFHCSAIIRIVLAISINRPILPTRASLAETTYYSQVQSLKVITAGGYDNNSRRDFSDEPWTI
jgi:hypothetical protein